MSILLDTHVLIWAAMNSSLLRPSAREILTDPEATIFVSAVSGFELAIKWSIGKLSLPVPPSRFVSEFLGASGFSQLAISIRDAVSVEELPLFHKDPFDRTLVAQARNHGLRLMTADPILEKYDVDVIALWLDDDE
jgi:PIN domain nuclease of toxin-antitoxin system